MKETHKSVSSGIGRRRFITTALGATAVAGFPSILRGAKQFEGKTLRVLTWSDATGQAAINNIVTPFMAETGCKVLSELVGGTSGMVAKVKASAAKPQYDLVILSAVGAFELARAGVLQKPNTDMLPNMSDVVPHMRLGADDHAVGYLLWCNGLLYNTQVLSTRPDSFMEMWNDEHSGKLVMPPPTTGSAMAFVALSARMAGGDERNVEPGFQMLEKLKDRVLLLGNNPAQLSELVRTGSITVGAPFSPNMFADFLRKPEFNVSINLGCKEGFFYDLQYMIVPKDHPGDDDAVHALLNHALDPQVQGRMAEAVNYGPINEKAVLSEAARSAPYIADPSRVAESGIDLDREYMSTVRQGWTQRYTEIFSG